ncbi:MAG: hypothetical protein DMF64_03110 [Acidobacteria bacterium]|nr:MAG: hypothetical protein DMF64_03110 [Acidobacteriota bacterium]
MATFERGDERREETENRKQMSGHKQKRKDETESQTNEQGFYVYCVGARAALESLFDAALPAAMEADARLELIADDALAAVCSAVSLADYGEEALQARLHDATWTALRALRHERVVEHFARRASVVPLRFGTIYLARGGVEQMLAERRAELQGIIERLRGREEWGVNVYCDRAKLLTQIVLLSPRLRELSEQAARATPGQSYLLQKKIEALRADETRAAARRTSNEIERELARVSAGVARLRVLKDEASEHGDAVVKFAFLVARARFDDFRAAAERLAEAHAPAGYKLELTGPWPAYNFAGGG